MLADAGNIDLIASWVIVILLPSIAFASFALVAYPLIARRTSNHRREKPAVACLKNHSFDLEQSLDLALRLNKYRVNNSTPQIVGLDSMLRIAPTDFDAASVEIADAFRAGRTVSIDLSKVNQHQAARLVDFCHGLTAMANGWIFRVTTFAIIISPKS